MSETITETRAALGDLNDYVTVTLSPDLIPRTGRELS